MVLLGFFHDSSLLLSPRISHLVVEESLPVRERVYMAEEDKEKSLKNHFDMTMIQTHNLSLLSRALYPLDHGGLPEESLLS